jgi:hypothetical protein
MTKTKKNTILVAVMQFGYLLTEHYTPDDKTNKISVAVYSGCFFHYSFCAGIGTTITGKRPTYYEWLSA